MGGSIAYPRCMASSSCTSSSPDEADNRDQLGYGLGPIGLVGLNQSDSRGGLCGIFSVVSDERA